MTTLYKKDNRGATRIWKIKAEDNLIIINYGVVDGAMQEELILIEEGLAGRTIEEQVQLRMDSRINKKLSSGYVDSLENINESGKNQLGLKRQMKGKLLKDGVVPKNVKYGKNSFAQRKYNGHRCTLASNGGNVVAYSTGGKLITSIEHILSTVKINDGQELDGELYIHGLSLQKISSKVRQQFKQSPDLKFIIFDLMSDAPFRKRFKSIPKQTSKDVIITETYQVSNFEQVCKLFFQFRGEKYEGAMLRHGKNGYDYGGRSAENMYKIKKRDGIGYYDEEFLVVNILQSVEGWARLVCETESGKQFKVSAPGTHYEKTFILHNKEKYIGKHIKVEFPEWTDDMVPSQPVAIMWREPNE